VREIIVYAITEKGLAVIRVLSFQKYLEKIGGTVRTIDEAQRVIPELSNRHCAS
jgi:DNA-binding PadR family transcriptional regulator